MSRLTWCSGSVVPVFLLAVLVWPGLAAGQLLGVHFFAGELYDVNPDTGFCDNPRLLRDGSNRVRNPVGITRQPGTGTLYMLTATTASFGGGALFTVDEATGEATRIGWPDLDGIFEGDLDFDPATGLLYGVQDGGLTGEHTQLFRLDPATAEATIIADLEPALGGERDYSAMAFDAAGTLHLLNTARDELLQVDPASGAVRSRLALTLPGDFTRTLGNCAAMDFAPLTGELYLADGCDGGEDLLFTVDLTTGALTEQGPTFLVSGLSGMEFARSPVIFRDGFEFRAPGAPFGPARG